MAFVEYNRDNTSYWLKLSWWNWKISKILANLDLLYQNPDSWTQDIKFREPEENSLSLSVEQLKAWKIL